MNGQDIYLKYVSPNKKSTVRHHRVWDKDRFLKARIEEGAKAAPADRFTIVPVARPPFGSRKA